MRRKIDKIYQTKIESGTSDYTKRYIELLNGVQPKTPEEEELVAEFEEARKMAI